MRVAIVGGGLVGRLAAWATMQCGHSPTLFDRMYEKVAKAPRGFVYLHEDCDLPLRAQQVTVIKQGNQLDYAKKVYGDPCHDVSFGKYDGVLECYEPAELLSILNGLQHGMVQERNFADIDDVLSLKEDYERLVFTLPISSFVKGNWPFVKGSVGAWPLNQGENLQNFCVYNSNLEIPWYRSGALFGWAFREFPTVISGHQPIIKVMAGGDELPKIKNVLFTGRFGAWRKNQLSHNSYREVLGWLGA